MGRKGNKIPKIIHYCWFGGKPLTDMALHCIESWKKYCPDYKIIQWNEDNFDIKCNDYVREAYKAQKWAFVSDYARFLVLYHEGGIYFDVDVEIISSINDIVEKGPFMGREGDYIAPGLGMGASPKMQIYKEILGDYEDKHFLQNNGNFDETTIVKIVTEHFQQYETKESGSIQYVAGINIYPNDFFCPLNYITFQLNITSNTRTIHHYMGSWLSEEQQYQKKIRKKMICFLPNRMADLFSKGICVIKYKGIKYAVSKVIKWIRET